MNVLISFNFTQSMFAATIAYCGAEKNEQLQQQQQQQIRTISKTERIRVKEDNRPREMQKKSVITLKLVTFLSNIRLIA